MIFIVRNKILDGKCALLQVDVINGVYQKGRNEGLWEFGAGKRLICCRSSVVRYKCVTISNVLKRIS